MADVASAGYDPACLWCGAALPSASHPGSERRFCSSKCRHSLHAACRSWAAQAVYDGRALPGCRQECLTKSVHACYRANHGP